jgi:hypothetical protein
MWEIKDSKIHGKGIFAKEDINKGSLIGKAYDLIGEVNDKYIAIIKFFLRPLIIYQRAKR